MAKLNNFEKAFANCFNALRVDIPVGFTYDNPYHTDETECILKSIDYFSSKVEYFTFEREYIYVTVCIGNRLYQGLFDICDESLIHQLIEKFLRVNR